MNQLIKTVNRMIWLFFSRMRLGKTAVALFDPHSFHTDFVSRNNIIIEPVTNHYRFFGLAVRTVKRELENTQIGLFDTLLGGSDDKVNV